MNFIIVVSALLAAGLFRGTRALPGNEVPSQSLPEGQCECAAFQSAEGDADDTPLVSQSPGVKVACDNDGAADCRKLCLALARAAGPRGPEFLCEAVPHIDSVKVAIFTRICDDGWKYTGVTARDPICCHDNKPLLCPGQDSYPSEPVGCEVEDANTPCE